MSEKRVIAKTEESTRAVPEPISVRIGEDNAVITGTMTTQVKGKVAYGTVTAEYTNETSPYVLGQPEIQSDGTVFYRLTWELDDLRQATDTTYFAMVYFNDGTSIATELTWVQPGRNASPDDGVVFDNRNLPRLATIADICGRGFNSGWLSPDDWQSLIILVQSLRVFNDIIWADGR